MFLQRCDAFKGLTADAITKVAGCMGKESFLDGTVIIKQGDEGDKFYVLRKGSVQVVFDDGRQPIPLGEGDFFGEMALLTGKPRVATVIARGPVETYTLGKQDFQASVSACDSFKEQVYKAYFQRQ